MQPRYQDQPSHTPFNVFLYLDHSFLPSGGTRTIKTNPRRGFCKWTGLFAHPYLVDLLQQRRELGRQAGAYSPGWMVWNQSWASRLAELEPRPWPPDSCHVHDVQSLRGGISNRLGLFAPNRVFLLLCFAEIPIALPCCDCGVEP